MEEKLNKGKPKSGNTSCNVQDGVASIVWFVQTSGALPEYLEIQEAGRSSQPVSLDCLGRAVLVPQARVGLNLETQLGKKLQDKHFALGTRAESWLLSQR